MKEFTDKVIDPVGIHARPASLVVMEASKFKCNVLIKSNGREANLKSIMNTLALAIKCNQKFTIVADGEDEQACIDQLKIMMKQNNLIN